MVNRVYTENVCRGTVPASTDLHRGKALGLTDTWNQASQAYLSTEAFRVWDALRGAESAV